MKEYRDFYFLKAKAENYPARSVYKLQELDKKFALFRGGMKALDLGAAPGSWTLYCAERAGASGLVVSCDLKAIEIAMPGNVRFFQDDILEPSEEFAAALRSAAPFDVVLSDMAPATTGSRFTDQARSHELALTAFETACACLKPGGKFVVKIFMGPDVKELEKAMRGLFRQQKSFKPKSSRAESKEIFLAGLDFRGQDAGAGALR